jgi:hypothetical protein
MRALRFTRWFPVVIAIAILGIPLGMLVRYAIRSIGDSRERAEYEHGITLPASAAAIQCRGDGWLRKSSFHGGGATALFTMAPSDKEGFMSTLSVRARTAPAISHGDPLVNGWNVWPQGSPTFIPGNPPYGGFNQTWQGFAEPVEMISCQSPAGGQWLHVEFWNLENGALLVKMGTMWPD